MNEVGDALRVRGARGAALERERRAVGERQRRTDEADVVDREAGGAAIDDLGGRAEQRFDRGARGGPGGGGDAGTGAGDRHRGLIWLSAREGDLDARSTDVCD